MAMLEMLPKVVGSEELLCLIALAEFVDIGQMLTASIPVLGEIGELVATVTTSIY